MCVKVGALALLLVMLTAGGHPASALVQKWCEGFYDDGITYKTLTEGTDITGTSHCPGEECGAIQNIICAVKGLAFYRQPNTMGYISPKDADEALTIYINDIRALGRQYPKRIPLYCKLLARVAPALTGDKAHDGTTLEDITSLALRLNRRHPSCLPQVVGALPPIPAIQDQLITLWGPGCMGPPWKCPRPDPPE